MIPSSDWVQKPGPGGIGITWKGKTLTSSYKPDEDARRRASALTTGAALVLLGWGSGHLIKALRQHQPERVLVAWEPHNERAQASRSYPGWSESDPWIVFLSGQEGVPTPLLQGFLPEHIHILIHPGLEDEPEIKTAHQSLCDTLDRLNVNERTLERFGSLWGRQAQKNIGSCSGYYSLNNLKEVYKGKNAVIFAAGPSLEGQIARLKTLTKEKAFVMIAVDTAISTLLSHGVEPDIVVSMDSQYWNSRHMDLTLPNNTLLVGEWVTPPSVLRRYRGRVYLSGSSIPMLKDIEADSLPHLYSGGSVAMAAGTLAGYLGVKQIIWVGLDLAYSGWRSHSRPSLIHKLHQRAVNRLSPLETLNSSTFWSSKLMRTRDEEGSLWLSDQRMPLYAKWMEGALSNSWIPPGVRASPGWPVQGLRVAESADWKELTRGGELPEPKTPQTDIPTTSRWEDCRMEYLKLKANPIQPQNPLLFHTWEEWLKPAAATLERWPSEGARLAWLTRWKRGWNFFKEESWKS